jgi:hypothetical protein
MMSEFQFVEDKNTVTIPVFSLDGIFSIEKVIEHKAINTEFYSKFGEFLKSLATSTINLQGYPFPKWDYSIESEYTVEEMVSIVMSILNSTASLKANDISLFTKPNQLSRKFVTAKQIRDAIASKTNLRAITLFNSNGGFELAGKIKSLTNNNNDYTLIISVMRDGDGKPRIYEYCSCPFHSTDNHFVCKHFLLAFIAFLPEILGSLDYLNSNSDYVGKNIINVENAIRNIINNNNKEYLEDGLIYYVIKYLVNKGFIEKVTVNDKEKIENTIVREDGGVKAPIDLIEKKQGVVSKEHIKIPVQPIKRIIWPDEMRRLRNNVISVISDLNKRFGLNDSDDNEWSTLLAFSMIMSSDALEPPIVLHSIGEIGTFKTVGSKMIAEYVEIPEIIIGYSGEDVVSKYYELIRIISSNFLIPQSNLENNVGGIITSLRILNNTLILALNKTFLLSLAKKSNSDLSTFINEIKNKGFNIDERITKPKIFIIDPSQLGNIEDYRIKFVPNEKIGLITQYDAFDNYIVVIDEGSRNPRGLETLLTKMSVSSLNENTRIIVITDNIEPFMEVATNKKYAPLHDRTYTILTNAIKNDLNVLQYFNKTPVAKINQLDLLSMKTFIDNIPVPESLLFLAKTLTYALAYRFSLGIIDGVKYLQLFSRSENESPPVEIDAFKKLSFEFVAGGRFIQHTLTLAKFFAFLNMHDHVTIEDFTKAIIVTAKSRIIVNAENYTDYKLMLLEIQNVLQDVLKNAEEIIKDVATIAVAPNAQLEKLFQTIISQASDTPIIAPAVASMIEILITKGIDLQTLPKNMQFTAIEILITKGDTFSLNKYSNISAVIERRKSIIKGE